MPLNSSDDCVRARVIEVGRSAVRLSEEDGGLLRAASIPKRERRLHLAPGDLVDATVLSDGRALVRRMLPRESVLERVDEDGRRKTMAANVDAVAILSALASPPPDFAMLDEILAVAELEGLAAHVFFTKPDLADPTHADALRDRYARLGYPSLLLDSRARRGVSEVEALLRTRRTVLVGKSGVGKSSLFGALGGDALVGEVSRAGRGRQTTSAGRLHRFAGGFLIDSPGVGEFALRGEPPERIAAGYVEFKAYLGACRFRDCRHLGEPTCAVLAAVAAGAIAPERYATYRTVAERTARE